MLMARKSTRLRRLPQAALWRSDRPAAFLNFCRFAISLTLSNLNFEYERATNPRALLHGCSHSSAAKVLITRWIESFAEIAAGQSVLRSGAGDTLFHLD